MRKMGWVLLCFVSALTACAQSAKQAVTAFQDSMKGKQVVLRNFSGEDKVQGRWTGGLVELDPPRWRTMGVLTVKSVKLKRGSVRIGAERRVALRDAAAKVVLNQQPDEMEIDVDLSGADPLAVLPELRNSLFYPTIADALAAVPAKMQKWVPGRIGEKIPDPKTAAQVASPACDCAAADRTGCGDIAGNTGMTMPKVLSMNDPGFSDSARRAKLNGDVILRFRVDQGGHPEAVWVVQPLGLGLDEAAAASVLKYRFKPAMCHNAPVAINVMTVVNFRIY